jgi:hypothetical protein
MSDWQVGDLAAGDDDAPYCSACQVDIECEKEGGDCPGGVLTVVGITPAQFWFGETHCGLIFAEDAPGVLPWCACQFRKVVSDKHEACEAEFLTLLKRSKRKVSA